MPSPSIVHIYLKPSFVSILNLTVIIIFLLYIEFCFHSGLGKALSYYHPQTKILWEQATPIFSLLGAFLDRDLSLIYKKLFSYLQVIFSGDQLFFIIRNLQHPCFCILLHSFLCSVDTSFSCFLILR